MELYCIVIIINIRTDVRASAYHTRYLETLRIPVPAFFSEKLYFAVTCMAKRLRWSRGSVLAFGTQVRGFKPGRSSRIFQGKKKSSACLPSLSHVVDLRHVKDS